MRIASPASMSNAGAGLSSMGGVSFGFGIANDSLGAGIAFAVIGVLAVVVAFVMTSQAAQRNADDATTADERVIQLSAKVDEINTKIDRMLP